MRVPSARPAPRGGGWLHALGGAHAAALMRRQPSPSSAEVDERGERALATADAATRHAAFAAYLQHLPLAREDRDDLRARGLSEETIRDGLYRSTPPDGYANAVVGRVAAAHDLRGVPGFYPERGAWRAAHVAPGYFVPVRDEGGLIRALLVRVRGAKYLWFSSAHKEGGATTGAPAHFALAAARIKRLVLLTEGALKADVAAELSVHPVIGLAGLYPPAGFAARLRRRFPTLESVVLCFDADFRAKRQVREAVFRLLRATALCGFDARVLVWNGPKGFDDLLNLANGEGWPR